MLSSLQTTKLERFAKSECSPFQRYSQHVITKFTLVQKNFHRNIFYQEVTGNPNVGFDDEDLEGDFDPAKYDEAMQVLNRIVLPIWNSAFNVLLLE